ncbi:acylphosphatase [Desulfococcus sp.]|uniref:acylphosphatase n=1 Tax=Desulfococcus sp. TaxID=2025834 RepID=UPI0035942794
MKRTRAHVVISGKVQGVFFRGETQRAAEARGVAGWVKNRPDGAVEAVFEGPEEAVVAMLEWCKNGSPRSRVDKMDVQWDADRREFIGFDIAY